MQAGLTAGIAQLQALLSAAGIAQLQALLGAAGIARCCRQGLQQTLLTAGIAPSCRQGWCQPCSALRAAEHLLLQSWALSSPKQHQQPENFGPAFGFCGFSIEKHSGGGEAVTLALTAAGMEVMSVGCFGAF